LEKSQQAKWPWTHFDEAKKFAKLAVQLKDNVIVSILLSAPSHLTYFHPEHITERDAQALVIWRGKGR
jgi:hypothetical protein